MGSCGRRVLSRAARSGLALLPVSVATALCQDVDQPIVPYDRKLYEHWTDSDADCLDTRQEVLIAESQSPVKLDSTGCRVLTGLWFDQYTGQRVTDPSRLDIDHLIPLAEAHRSGAGAWTPSQRRRFANDLTHTDSLIAVTAESNRSKGDSDPALWLPPNEGFRCEYVRRWVIAKATWGLDMDPAEREAVRGELWKCGVATSQYPAEGGSGPGPGLSGDGNDATASTRGEPSTVSRTKSQGEDTAIDSGTAGPLAIGTGYTPASAAVARDPESDPEAADAYCEQLVRTPCIDMNAAALETLSCAKGLGSVKSQAIIDYRTSNGPFQKLGDLDDVPGIGPATINSIRLSGFCVGPQDDTEGPERSVATER